jgi:hypothetical protein
VRAVGPRNRKVTFNLSDTEVLEAHEVHLAKMPKVPFATFVHRVFIGAIREPGTIPVATVAPPEPSPANPEALAVAMAFIVSFLPNAHLTYENALKIAKEVLRGNDS